MLHGRHIVNLPEVEDKFHRWRMIYSNEPPHEATGMATSLTRFRQSRLACPEQLPEIDYLEEDLVEAVS